MGRRRGGTKVKVCPFVFALGLLLSLLGLTGSEVKVEGTMSNSLVLAVAKALSWFGLFLGASSNIDLQLFSLLDAKIDILAKFFIKFFLITE